MAKRKYKHLVKPLSVGGMRPRPRQRQQGAKVAFANGPGNADKLVWLNGRDHLEGLELNFTWGFYSGPGDWHSGQDPHVHPYAECLVFVGLDSANLGYLGAEIDVCLGEELETYSFDEPTVVAVPAGFPHCPLVTRTVRSPKGFGFFLASLGAAPATTWMGEGASEEALTQMQEAAARSGRQVPMKSTVSKKRIKNVPGPATGKYAGMLTPLKAGLVTQRGGPVAGLDARKHETAAKGMRPGPGNADHLARLSGRDLNGLEVSFDFGYFSRPGIWHRGAGAHVHPFDEVLVFAGLDPADIDYLGAEIEIELGPERERYIIDHPTVVICPRGLPHAPIVSRWVDRPYAFYSIHLAGEYRASPAD